MKYLFSLLLVGMSFITIAQNRDGNMRGNYNMKGNNNFTPEQYAELQTKRLTLALELTSAQQKQVLEINKKRAVELKKNRESILANKESGKTMSSDERFKMMNNQLDQTIAMQNSLKKILNADQYEQWKATKQQRNMGFNNYTGNNNSRGNKSGSHKKMRNR